MYDVIGMSASSLHRESPDSLILSVYSVLSTKAEMTEIMPCMERKLGDKINMTLLDRDNTSNFVIIIWGDFNDFPDGDLFASVQDSGDPECKKWKQPVSDVQSQILKEGRVLQVAANETEEKVKVYSADQSKGCDLKCPNG